MKGSGSGQVSPLGQANQALSRLPSTASHQYPGPQTQTHVPQVEGDLQLTPEGVCKGGVHVQHLQQVCSMDLVQVTVGQGTHICA